jgi:mono/diheme cytochrome c family protein
VPLALSTGNAVGLAVISGAFIVFALLSALVIPRRWPQYPGARMGWFIAATLVFFVATLGAVEVFAKEEPEEAAVGETATEPEGTTTEGAGATTEGAQPPPPPPAEEGDPAAGREVFVAQCGACHAFSAAGTSGAAGPNLDEAVEGEDPEAVREAIVDPNEEIAEGYAPNVMPQNFEETLTPKQLDDVVAFLTQG